MDFALNINNNGSPQVSLDSADTLQNAVLLSLHIKRGAFFFNPDFGSRLHEIRSLSPTDIALAQQYAAECLEWLVTIKRVNSISVSAFSKHDGMLNLNIALSRISRADLIYETSIKVV